MRKDCFGKFVTGSGALLCVRRFVEPQTRLSCVRVGLPGTGAVSPRNEVAHLNPVVSSKIDRATYLA